MENLVEIKDVSFSYGFRPVLKGINMTVPRGKVVSIMGLSGCGKTTLLRLIAGALRPRKGEVTVAGRLMNRLDRDGLYALRRKMGMLFQFGALFTDMSVFDNVAFQMREHTDLPEDMIHDLVLMKLHAVGLRGAHQLMPAELSGGMARRVALARAIALDPMLIMYDEPFTGLDPISLGVIGNLIRRLNDALGATSIVVTHDVQETLQDRRLRLFHVGRGDRRAGHAGGDPQVGRTVRAPVRVGRDGRPGAVPYPGCHLCEGPGAGGGACLSASSTALRGIGKRSSTASGGWATRARFFLMILLRSGDELPPLRR